MTQYAYPGDYVVCLTDEYKYLNKGSVYKVDKTKLSLNGNMNYQIDRLYYWYGKFKRVDADLFTENTDKYNCKATFWINGNPVSVLYNEPLTFTSDGTNLIVSD